MNLEIELLVEAKNLSVNGTPINEFLKDIDSDGINTAMFAFVLAAENITNAFEQLEKAKDNGVSNDEFMEKFDALVKAVDKNISTLAAGAYIYKTINEDNENEND